MAYQSSVSKSKNKCTVYELCMKMIEEKNYGIAKSEPKGNTWDAFGSHKIAGENVSLDRYIAERFSIGAENCSTVKPEQQEKNTSNELCLKISEAKSILLEEIETFSMKVKNCAIERCNENPKEANENNLCQIDQVVSVDKLGMKTNGVKNISVDINLTNKLLVKEELIMPDLKMQYVENQSKSNDFISYGIAKKTLSTVQKPCVSKLCTRTRKKTEISVSKKQNVETINCSVRKHRKERKRCYRMAKCKFCKNVFSRECFNSHIDKCTKKDNVWEACKKALAEKSNSQTSCKTPEIITPDLPPLKKDSLIKSETLELPPLENDLNSKLNYLTEKDSLFNPKILELSSLKNDLNIKLSNLTENDLVIKPETSELLPLKNDLNSKLNNLTEKDSLIEAKIPEFLPLKNDFNRKLNYLSENGALIQAETENKLYCDMSKNLEDVGIACNKCGIQFTEMKKFYLHHCYVSSEECYFPLDCKGESADELLVCNLCGLCLNEMSAFQSHCHNHFPEELDGVSVKEEKPLLCVKCGARFLILEELKSHCLTQIHGKPCRISEKNDLQSHYPTAIEGQPQIEVENPSQSIVNANDVFYNNSVYVCSVCKIWFTDRKNIFYHPLTHTGDSNKVVDMIKHYCFCISCGVYFTIEDFQQHHTNHASYKSVNFKDILMTKRVCEKCGYEFPKMDEYDAHICSRIKIQSSAVIKEQGYMRRRCICKICDLSFTKRETYNSHYCMKTKVLPRAVKKIQPKVLRKIQPKAFIKEHEDMDDIRMPCICKHCGLGFTKKEMFDSHHCVTETEPLILYELVQRKVRGGTKRLVSQDCIGRKRQKETKSVILQHPIGRKRMKETKTIIKEQITRSKKYKTYKKSKKVRKYFC